jgi:hypothetical protein
MAVGGSVLAMSLHLLRGLNGYVPVLTSECGSWAATLAAVGTVALKGLPMAAGMYACGHTCSPTGPPPDTHTHICRHDANADRKYFGAFQWGAPCWTRLRASCPPLHISDPVFGRYGLSLDPD